MMICLLSIIQNYVLPKTIARHFEEKSNHKCVRFHIDFSCWKLTEAFFFSLAPASRMMDTLRLQVNRSPWTSFLANLMGARITYFQDKVLGFKIKVKALSSLIFFSARQRGLNCQYGAGELTPVTPSPLGSDTSAFTLSGKTTAVFEKCTGLPILKRLQFMKGQSTKKRLINGMYVAHIGGAPLSRSPSCLYCFFSSAADLTERSMQRAMVLNRECVVEPLCLSDAALYNDEPQGLFHRYYMVEKYIFLYQLEKSTEEIVSDGKLKYSIS